MSRNYVCEFDDLCDATAATLDTLARIKEKEPKFQVTLFTIPRRTSPETIAKAKALGDWIHLAPHGWRHTRGECLGWAKEEALLKISLARDMGIDSPCFKAPAWLIDTEIYDACEELGYVVCDHKDFHEPNHSTRVYRYNDHLYRAKKTTPIHGHLTNCMDNWIEDMAKDGRLSFATGSTFLTLVEAAV